MLLSSRDDTLEHTHHAALASGIGALAASAPDFHEIDVAAPERTVAGCSRGGEVAVHSVGPFARSRSGIEWMTAVLLVICVVVIFLILRQITRQ
jgi:hypothetical protein